MRHSSDTTARSRWFVVSSLLWAVVSAAACGVAVEDRTAVELARTPTSIYELTARVERVGLTAIVSVDAVTSYGTYPMSPGSEPMEWVTQLPLNPCVNGFDVRFVVDWSWPPAGNIERAPEMGVHQKWIAGDPPALCEPPLGHLYTVTSTEDLPDEAPGDGMCRAPGGACTLRAAVMEANKQGGQDRIELGSQTYMLTRIGDDDSALAGDLDITDEVALTGNGATIDASRLGDRVLHVIPAGDELDVDVRGIVVRGGSSQLGGGIRNLGRLHLLWSVVRDNVAQHGGGIYNEGGFVEIDESQIAENEASAGTGNAGGGILSTGAGAFVTVRASSVIGNVSSQHGGGLAIFNGRFEIRDSTISGNRAEVHAGGLALWQDTVHARIRNVTITDNNADADGTGGGQGSGISVSTGGFVVYVANSIIAGNYRGDVAPVPDDCWGTLTSFGFNLIGVEDGCVGLTAEDLRGSYLLPLDAQLEPLSSMGSARSHMPKPSSPALDAGDPDPPNDASTARCTHVDQRGAARPKGPLFEGQQRCDIGAVER